MLTVRAQRSVGGCSSRAPAIKATILHAHIFQAALCHLLVGVRLVMRGAEEVHEGEVPEGAPQDRA